MDMAQTLISIHGDIHGYPYPRQAWKTVSFLLTLLLAQWILLICEEI